MKYLNDILGNFSRLLMVVTLAFVGSFGTAMAGDIAEYANTAWLKGGFIWGTTEIRGCRDWSTDPDGCTCGGIAVGAYPADAPPWTFEVGPGGASFTVVDNWANVDQYAVFDSGVFIGVTSEPSVDPYSCGEPPEDCMAADQMSKGSFEMAPGLHSITMFVVQTNPDFPAGHLYFRVDGDVVGGVLEEEVEIDIQPNKTANKIRLDDTSLVPVAILSTEDFDARLVDPASVRFGPAGAEPVPTLTRFKDVNRDHYTDHFFRFVASETGILCGDTEATLTGTWNSEEGVVAISGTDSFTTRCK